ncbi:MAG: alpha/beta hydrolase [Pseudomonadota bacterium]
MGNITFRRGIPGIVPDAYIVGATAPTQSPPVVAVHGIRREVESMAQLMERRAREIVRTIVLPHFDIGSWKRYQMAACKNRSDLGLLALMDNLVREGHVNAGRFDLSGFSGGAQFAHRFAWIHPDVVDRLCLTAPGWWTFPEVEISWPYGTGTSSGPRSVTGHWLQANLASFLDREITVCVGSEDVSRDKNLRKGDDIDAQQGMTRVTRAKRWCDAISQAAKRAGVTPHISFELLEGCGHSFETCAVRARLDQHFAAPARRCAGCAAHRQCTKHISLKGLERTAA